MKNSRMASRQFTSAGRAPFALAVALMAFSALACATADGAVDVTFAFPAPQAQQGQLSGEWVAEFRSNKPGEIHFTFHRRSEGGGFNMTGDSLQLTELQGLSADVASAARTNV